LSSALNHHNLDTVFPAQVPNGSGQTHHTEESKGKLARSICHSSIALDGQQETEVPHFASKDRIGKHIVKNAKGIGIGRTILQFVVFMENSAPGFQSRLFITGIEAYVGKENGVAWAVTEDIGLVAAQVIQVSPTHLQGSGATQ